MKNITNKSKSIIITLKTIKMKKLFILLLFLTGIANAQIINIPDANFKAKLLAANTTNSIAGYIKIDTNSDGQIQSSEAINITELNVSNSNISSLVGIRSFLNVNDLSCGGNLLTTLSVLNLNSLQTLSCSNNNLTSINFSGTNLTIFDCSSNQLSSLNVSNLANLAVLECNNNILTSLNFGSIDKVGRLVCKNNLLTTLDTNCFNNNSYAGPSFDCSYNQLTSLIIGQGALGVNCAHNLLTTLDFSNRDPTTNGSNDLTYFYLDCSFNQLSNLNITNSNFGNFNCRNNLLTSIDLSRAC